MHFSVYKFFFDITDINEYRDKSILEIGSYDVNGSLRPIIFWSMAPASYVGTDLREGPMVDRVIPAELLDTYYIDNFFDAIICTEMLEHTLEWRKSINNMKHIVRVGGSILLTTRSIGFPLHDYPHDYWRFNESDMIKIFSDFDMIHIGSDPQFPGVFIKVRKPERWENDPTSRVDLDMVVPYRME